MANESRRVYELLYPFLGHNGNSRITDKCQWLQMPYGVCITFSVLEEPGGPDIYTKSASIEEVIADPDSFLMAIRLELSFLYNL